MKTQHLFTTSFKVFCISLMLSLTACGDSGTASTPPDPISIISVNPSGAPGNFSSFDCGESCTNMNTTGRYVVFSSLANDLVANDTNGRDDIFIRDMEAGTTTRVSIPNLSDQGTLGSEANSYSRTPTVSSNGRYVVFDSAATNLVVGDANAKQDVFLHDTQTGETVRVSTPNLANQATLGTEAFGISSLGCVSDDGRYVGFQSYAPNIVTSDLNLASDIFVHDRQTGVTAKISQHTDETPGNLFSDSCAMSSDGKIIAYYSAASTLVTGDTNVATDVFVHDLNTDITTRISVDSAGNEGTGGSATSPQISGDGRYVTFYSTFSNLVSGGSSGFAEIFVHDRNTGATTRASAPNLLDQGTLGTQADNDGSYPSISDNGRYVAWGSNATNLVLNDTNDKWDIFVYDRVTGRTARANVDVSGNQMETIYVSDWAGISGDGRYVNFYGSYPNTSPSNTDLRSDVFRAPNPLWE